MRPRPRKYSGPRPFVSPSSRARDANGPVPRLHRGLVQLRYLRLGLRERCAPAPPPASPVDSRPLLPVVAPASAPASPVDARPLLPVVARPLMAVVTPAPAPAPSGACAKGCDTPERPPLRARASRTACAAAFAFLFTSSAARSAARRAPTFCDKDRTCEAATANSSYIGSRGVAEKDGKFRGGSFLAQLNISSRREASAPAASRREQKSIDQSIILK